MKPKDELKKDWEALRSGRNEAVPPGWTTARDLAQQNGQSHSWTRGILGELVESGVWEKRKFKGHKSPYYRRKPGRK